MSGSSDADYSAGGLGGLSGRDLVQLRLDLIGKRGGLVEGLKRYVSGLGESDIRSRLDDESDLIHKALYAGRTVLPPSGELLAEPIRVDLECARRLAVFADALRDPGPDLCGKVSAFHSAVVESQVRSVGANGMLASGARLSPICKRLWEDCRLAEHLENGPTTLLTAMELTGVSAGVIRTAVVPTLLAVSRHGQPWKDGRAAHITLRWRDAGPIGLHPDPATMGFFLCDEEFMGSLRTAWSLASEAIRGKACITWELSFRDDVGETCLEADGASLGAAVAIALDELAGTRRFRGLRPRLLDPRCAVSARVLPNGRLGRVTRIDAKVRAADAAGLRVVVAAGALAEARRALPSGSAVTIDGCADLGSAIRAARTRLNSSFVWATAVVLLAFFGTLWPLGSWLYGLWDRRQPEHDERVLRSIFVRLDRDQFIRQVGRPPVLLLRSDIPVPDRPPLRNEVFVLDTVFIEAFIDPSNTVQAYTVTLRTPTTVKVKLLGGEFTLGETRHEYVGWDPRPWRVALGCNARAVNYVEAMGDPAGASGSMKAAAGSTSAGFYPPGEYIACQSDDLRGVSFPGAAVDEERHIIPHYYVPTENYSGSARLTDENVVNTYTVTSVTFPFVPQMFSLHPTHVNDLERAALKPSVEEGSATILSDREKSEGGDTPQSLYPDYRCDVSAAKLAAAYRLQGRIADPAITSSSLTGWTCTYVVDGDPNRTIDIHATRYDEESPIQSYGQACRVFRGDSPRLNTRAYCDPRRKLIITGLIDGKYNDHVMIFLEGDFAYSVRDSLPILDVDRRTSLVARSVAEELGRASSSSNSWQSGIQPLQGALPDWLSGYMNSRGVTPKPKISRKVLGFELGDSIEGVVQRLGEEHRRGKGSVGVVRVWIFGSIHISVEEQGSGVLARISIIKRGSGNDSWRVALPYDLTIGSSTVGDLLLQKFTRKSEVELVEVEGMVLCKFMSSVGAEGLWTESFSAIPPLDSDFSAMMTQGEACMRSHLVLRAYEKRRVADS